MTVEKRGFDPVDVENNKTMAGVGYIVPILLFIMMKDSKFIKFHANQVLLFLICGLLLGGTASALIAIVAFSGNFIVMGIIGLLCSPIYLSLSILGLINMIAAFKGEAKRFPIIGKYTLIPNSNDVEVEDSIKHELLNKLADKVDNVSFSEMSNLVSNPCPSCNEPILMGKKFCNKCGYKMPEKEKAQKVEKAEAEIQCTSCKKEYFEEIKFCSECGGATEKKPKMSVPACTNCKLENTTGAKFCPECGGAVVTEEIKPVVCKGCDYTFTDKEKFCPECGGPREE